MSENSKPAKPSKPPTGSQERFLNAVLRENVPVIIYLVNSIQLRGNIRGFDTFAIVLESPGRPISLVYKSAITSILPARPIRLYNSIGRADQSTQLPKDERIA